jgi:AcrR family transcriptional regulator
MAKATIEATRPSAAQRLHDALATLLRQQTEGESSKELTALAVCQLAGISRNALYRYHPDVLLSLHEAQSRRHARPAAKRIARQLRQENRELRDQLTQLAALVDHYFAAWQETRLQLERRDREVAELRRGHRPQVVPFRH